LINPLVELPALIERERDALLTEWRRQVRALPSAAALDVPTLNDHIPTLIRELVEALRRRTDETIPEALMAGTPPAHGTQRLEDGFDIVELVAEYNILRGCIHDLAESNGVQVQGQAFRILNRTLDGAIGVAVDTFAAARAREVHQRREEYLAFVAHDLRTPLNAIALVTRMLQTTLEATPLPAEGARWLQALTRNIQQIDALVGKVLEENTHAAADAGLEVHRRWFDLWPLVESVIVALRPVSTEADIAVHNDVPFDLRVWADAGLVQRIVQNLLANAITHAAGGVIHIEANELETTAGVECRVRDNGSGIPVERLDAVFDKFESDVDGDGKLHGLGLPIVRALVEAHGGHVRAESSVGAGTTFRFTLAAPPA
jgi:two-component system, OmpR family, phosphate regulon sensor histidine kinase PhoR